MDVPANTTVTVPIHKEQLMSLAASVKICFNLHIAQWRSFNLEWLIWNRSVKMYTSLRKIHKDKDAEPSEFEETVAQVSYFLLSQHKLLCAFLGACFRFLIIVLFRPCMIWKTPTRSSRVTWKTFSSIQQCKNG